MIATLTFSPALDLSSSVETLTPWRKMRCTEVTAEPGGGGINVARAVRSLGGAAHAIAALGGRTGSEVARLLRNDGIQVQRIAVRQATRFNYVTFDRTAHTQYRFVHPSAPMSRGELTRCLDAAVRAAENGAAVIVASSSLAPGIPVDVFSQLADRLEQCRVPLIVDTSGPALEATLESSALLVKPSVNELRAITAQPLTNNAEIVAAARTLLARGQLRFMVVSLGADGADGAVLVPAQGPASQLHAPAVSVSSSSGAGDSMVAGIAVGLVNGCSMHEACRMGVAAGTAAVLSTGTGLCRRADVDRLLPLVAVTTLDQ